jgi:hypothetical protein
MIQGSFTATLPGLVLAYTDGAGFESSRPDDLIAVELNAELVLAPGKSHTPRALLAQEVLARILPTAVVSDLVIAPLAALEGDPEKVIP